MITVEGLVSITAVSGAETEQVNIRLVDKRTGRFLVDIRTGLKEFTRSMFYGSRHEAIGTLAETNIMDLKEEPIGAPNYQPNA
jgi:hypothetical protein